jgi:hypothetical protein
VRERDAGAQMLESVEGEVAMLAERIRDREGKNKVCESKQGLQEQNIF